MLLKMLWIGILSPTAQTVYMRVQPQPLCYSVNQLDTA